MEVIRQNQDIRNMRCQNGNAKTVQQSKLSNFQEKEKEQIVMNLRMR